MSRVGETPWDGSNNSVVARLSAQISDLDDKVEQIRKELHSNDIERVQDAAKFVTLEEYSKRTSNLEEKISCLATKEDFESLRERMSQLLSTLSEMRPTFVQRADLISKELLEERHKNLLTLVEDNKREIERLEAEIKASKRSFFQLSAQYGGWLIGFGALMLEVIRIILQVMGK